MNTKKYITLDQALEVLDRQSCYWAAEYMKLIPAANVREVVYCEDCDAYKQSNWIDKHMECARFKCPVSKKDFCSSAVKK